LLRKPQAVQSNCDGTGTEASCAWYVYNKQRQELANTNKGVGSVVMFYEEEK